MVNCVHTKVLDYALLPAHGCRSLASTTQRAPMLTNPDLSQFINPDMSVPRPLWSLPTSPCTTKCAPPPLVPAYFTLHHQVCSDPSGPCLLHPAPPSVPRPLWSLPTSPCTTKCAPPPLVPAYFNLHHYQQTAYILQPNHVTSAAKTGS